MYQKLFPEKVLPKMAETRDKIDTADRSGRASLQFKTAIEMYEAESDEVKAYVAAENRKQKEARLAALKEEPLEVEGKVERVPEAYQRHVCCWSLLTLKLITLFVGCLKRVLTFWLKGCRSSVMKLVGPDLPLALVLFRMRMEWSIKSSAYQSTPFYFLRQNNTQLLRGSQVSGREYILPGVFRVWRERHGTIWKVCQQLLLYVYFIIRRTSSNWSLQLRRFANSAHWKLASLWWKMTLTFNWLMHP